MRCDHNRAPQALISALRISPSTAALIGSNQRDPRITVSAMADLSASIRRRERLIAGDSSAVSDHGANVTGAAGTANIRVVAYVNRSASAIPAATTGT